MSLIELAPWCEWSPAAITPDAFAWYLFCKEEMDFFPCCTVTHGACWEHNTYSSQASHDCVHHVLSSP